MIRELALRTNTGATVVAIQRSGENVISPSPDEEFQLGDEVMLVGNADQVAAAEAVLAPAAKMSDPQPA